MRAFCLLTVGSRPSHLRSPVCRDSIHAWKIQALPDLNVTHALKESMPPSYRAIRLVRIAPRTHLHVFILADAFTQSTWQYIGLSTFHHYVCSQGTHDLCVVRRVDVEEHRTYYYYWYYSSVQMQNVSSVKLPVFSLIFSLILSAQPRPHSPTASVSAELL